MKKNIKKIVIFLIQWIIVGVAVVLLVYPKTKSGSIEKLAFHKCFHDMSKYTVLLYNDEPGEHYGEEYSFSSDNTDEAGNADKIMQYLAKVKVKEKGEMCVSKYLYKFRIIDGNKAATDIYVYKDSVMCIQNKQFNRTYEVLEPDEGLKSMNTFLEKIKEL